MTELNIVLATVGGMVMLFGLLSRPLKRSFLSAPLLALLLGVVFGPSALGLLNPEHWGPSDTILEQAARFTLAIGLMGVALRLPPDFPFRHWRSLAILLVIGMPLMWLSSSLLTYAILGLPLIVSLLVGAAVCPTDPVVASTIVTGDLAQKVLPKQLRHTLSIESGANDGLAHPIVLLPILLLTKPAGEVWGHWLGYVIVWEVGGAVVIGALLGLGAGHLLEWAEQRKTIDIHSFLAFTVALTLFALGAGKLLGINDIVAVFVAGIAMDRVASASERHEEERVQEAVNQFFTVPIFTLLGLLLPWDQWRELGWRGLALVAAVLLLRRLPFFLGLSRVVPEMKSLKDAFFLGWFGPIGVAAIFYAMLAVRRTGQQEVWAVSSLLICASIIAHGMSAAPLTKLYGRKSQQTASA